jgi:hypothetical protein
MKPGRFIRRFSGGIGGRQTPMVINGFGETLCFIVVRPSEAVQIQHADFPVPNAAVNSFTIRGIIAQGYKTRFGTR